MAVAGSPSQVSIGEISEHLSLPVRETTEIDLPAPRDTYTLS
jgi:hypothetical protein